jgi:hypothetical protein
MRVLERYKEWEKKKGQLGKELPFFAPRGGATANCLA